MSVKEMRKAAEIFNRMKVQAEVDKILHRYRTGYYQNYLVDQPLKHKKSELAIKVGSKVYWAPHTIKNHRLDANTEYEVLGTIQWIDAESDKFRAGDILVYSAGKVRQYSARDCIVVEENAEKYISERDKFQQALAAL